MIKTVISIDQQGGKSNVNYQIDINCTLLSDSHGTPHAVCIVYEKSISDRKSSQRLTSKDKG